MPEDTSGSPVQDDEPEDQPVPRPWEPPGGWPPPPPGDQGRPFAWGPPPGAPETRPPHRSRLAAAILAGLLLLSSGIGIGWVITRNGSPAVQGPITAAPANPSTGQADRGLNVQAVADRVDPAVVDVNTIVQADALGRTAQGAGTGMVVTASGEVLTNNHVIQGATRIDVTIAGRGRYTAHVLGADPTDDIALLQVDGVSGLPVVTLADSSSVTVGQEVVAIGNALGQGGTPSVTQGTVSALDRSITVRDDRGGAEQLSGLIQTDALIQPGDSGGPLVNSAGQVIGMITAAARGNVSEPVARVGFAIPSNTALRIVNEIRAGHSSDSIIIGEAGYLGVEVRDLDAATIARLGLRVSSGVLVMGVSPGTPAQRAGIGQYSVITEIDGRKVSSTDELGSAIHRHKPGEQIRVTWVDRTGATHVETVTLISGPAI